MTNLTHDDNCYDLQNMSTGTRAAFDAQGPLLLTWFNFNPSMDKLSHPL